MPTIRHNDDEITWEQRPPKHTVPAIGLRRIVPGHCTVTGPFNHCPDKRSGFCHGWHPDYQLVAAGRWTTSSSAPANSAVVFHQDRKKRVRVVLADSMPVYEDLTGLTGEFAPGTRTPLLRPVKDDGPRECTAVRAVETFVYGDPCILLRGNELPAPPPPIERRNWDYHDPDGSRLATIRRITAEYPPCTVCGAPMTAGQSGTHLSCRSATTPTTNGTSR